MIDAQAKRNAPLVFRDTPDSFKLKNGSQIAIIGGGPAGSFTGYYFLDMAARADMNIRVDIFEPKDYTIFGPTGCNHCGGVVSESLVQILAAEGITIPANIVRRGINAYVLHMDVGSVRINTPSLEKRIVAMFRGAGPMGTTEAKWGSFDGYLQNLTKKAGAKVIHDVVKNVDINPEGYPVVKTRKGIEKPYDLLVGAGGVKASFLNLFKKLDLQFQAPVLTKTAIREFYLERDRVHKYFGDAMHVFLLDIPRLKFAALIPKGDFVTLALLGEKIDKNLVQAFLESPVVQKCFPPEWNLSDEHSCQCFPSINIQSAVKPFGNRIVMVGDSATTKLYKNGIGAAYITAKVAATTAIFQGVSSQQFEEHYWPVCKSIDDDNAIGKSIFSLISIIQKQNFIKRGMLNVVQKENQKNNRSKPMSMVLWDTFTGNAPYQEILMRMTKPSFFFPLIGQIFKSLLPGRRKANVFEPQIASEAGIGKIYKDGELIIKQGEEGDCMYVIQYGEVKIIKEKNGYETNLATMSAGDFFGEMSLFEKEVRSATVRAKGEVQVITIDKKTLLNRIQQDPAMAFRILQNMSLRMRELGNKVAKVKSTEDSSEIKN